MKLVTYTQNDQPRTGVLRSEEVIDLNHCDSSIPSDMVSLLEGGDKVLQKVKKVLEVGTPTKKVSDVRLEAPVLKPSKILAVALNYYDHLTEIPESFRNSRFTEFPKNPVIFNKQSTSINGPYDPILLPPESEMLDYEAELAVIIGKKCRRVPEERAIEVIAGYSIFNDVSVRDWQMSSPTLTMGKSWDTHSPIGPCIVTRDEIRNAENLNIRLTVDGEMRQKFNTRDMLFKIAKQIAYLSTAFTLLPGDIIATGTSAGVANWMPEQPFLKAGQVCRIEIDKIGAIENTIVEDKQKCVII